MSRPAVQIASIVTPASNYNLVDLTTLKTLLGITTTTYDAFLNLVIPQASTAAQTFTNNPFVVETIQDQFWPGADGWPYMVRRREAPLQLSRWPIVSVVSVVETINNVVTTLTLGTDYLADTASGQLTRLSTYSTPPVGIAPWPVDWRANPIVAQYVAGYVTIPGDVFDAVVTIIKAKWYAQQRDPFVRSENVPGVLSQSYFQMDSATGLPVDAVALLRLYRVPVVG